MGVVDIILKGFCGKISERITFLNLKLQLSLL